ncbi:MAG: LysR family transcriptional regulator [Pseudomonadota bacterium]
MQWDDLRFFIAAARSGSFSEAASTVGADVATVSRRVARLEATVKATLFVRSAQGLKLTAIGRQVFEKCDGVESAVASVSEAIGPGQAVGTVRVSASEGFGACVVAPALAAFQDARSGLAVELVAEPGFLSPTTRAADVAITLSAPADPKLIVEPLTEYRLGLFSSEAYLAASGKPKQMSDLKRHRIVGYVDDLIFAPELQYLQELLPELKPSVSSTSIRAQRAILENGGGIGVLPYFLAHGLAPVFRNKVILTRRFWMATHRDVADTARVKTVRSWLQTVVDEKADLLWRHPAGSTY